MLTSSQYHYPDYLQPLPTTLDAKKSPLALLAQTCSSIGKDSSASKQIIPPIEKRDADNKPAKDSPPSDKPCSGDCGKRSSAEDKKDSAKPGFRTVPPKEIPPLVPISSSPGERMPTPAATSETSRTSPESSSVSGGVSTRPTSAAGTTSSGRMSLGSVSDLSHHDSTGLGKAPPSQPPSMLSSSALAGGMKASHPSLMSGLPAGAASLSSYGCLPLVGHGIPCDAANSSPVYPSPLAAHSGLNLASQSVAAAAAAAAAANSNALKISSQASTVSPYIAYARVRTPSGATTLVPVCRDPYCTNCQLTLQNSHLSSTCTSPGCAQCAHEKSLLHCTNLGFSGTSFPILSSISSAATLPSAVMAANSSLSLGTLYQHGMLGTHLPYICSWVAGNDYCGKRFGTSEELLQHLRTHTTANDSAILAANYNLSLPPVTMAGCHGQYSTPGSLSPNSLRRTYPTSLSPVSGILSASRYHPYKSPFSSVPTVGTNGLPLPTLGGTYLSPPYLYGHRLGAAAVP